ncbi:hypothetical protein CBL_00290 [Carabus blaptoides fortunei]
MYQHMVLQWKNIIPSDHIKRLLLQSCVVGHLKAHTHPSNSSTQCPTSPGPYCYYTAIATLPLVPSTQYCFSQDDEFCSAHGGSSPWSLTNGTVPLSTDRRVRPPSSIPLCERRNAVVISRRWVRRVNPRLSSLPRIENITSTPVEVANIANIH